MSTLQEQPEDAQGKFRVDPPGSGASLLRRILSGVNAARREIRLVDWILIAQTLLVIVPLWQYYRGAGDRQRTKHYQAWQVIALASERGGDGGRRQALQDLHHDGVPLRGVEISGAIIDSLRLDRVSMKWANLENVNFTHAWLVGATFGRARAGGARFLESRMEAADFSMAGAATAAFDGTTLCDALFIGTDLRRASFLRAVLDGADFTGADLREARFSPTAVPTGATFKSANIAGIQASASLIRAALASGAVSLGDSAWRARRAAEEGALKDHWRAVPNPADGITPRRERDCLGKLAVS